jgi:hypothetical protein
MAEVELTEDVLLIHVRGLDRIFALKSRLEIPLSHVLGAEADPELGHPEWWKSLRLTATQIPWVVTAGTFYQEGERVFWDVHDPEKVVVIRLSDERYARVVIGVEDPASTAKAIEAAIGGG